jgi:ABC-type cobalamin/Fe3+-siderophores transport system ATPase subunit
MSPLLRLESVSVRYWRGPHAVEVLKDVALELEAGEFCGVYGDRSAGKTTLARVTAGVQPVDSGLVALGGMPISHAQPGAAETALRMQIGFASRGGPTLESLSVREWVASSLLTTHRWRASLRCAQAALAEVGADDLGGQPWRNLSDSERMRVAIAHAIVRRPKILVVDDPVAGLGVAARAEVMELLRAIADDGVGVLMTAGDAIELAGANRIWALAGGRLNGPPARPVGAVVPLRPAKGM